MLKYHLKDAYNAREKCNGKSISLGPCTQQQRVYKKIPGQVGVGKDLNEEAPQMTNVYSLGEEPSSAENH